MNQTAVTASGENKTPLLQFKNTQPNYFYLAVPSGSEYGLMLSRTSRIKDDSLCDSWSMTGTISNTLCITLHWFIS